VSRAGRVGLSDLLVLFFAITLGGAGTVAVKQTLAGDAPGQGLHLLSLPPGSSSGLNGPLSILLVGADDRADRGRADSIMVAYINPVTKRAVLMSIQRDTRVAIPGHGRSKINHAYRFGGVPLLKQTVEGLLGQPLDRYAKLDFDTFAHAVDALGGADINVGDAEGHGRGMNYDDNAGKLHIHLKPGLQHLDGKQAIGYVRYRKDSDLKRAERQREFVKAMADQHIRATQLPRLVGVGRFVLSRIDTDLGNQEALKLAATLHGIEPGDVMAAILPTRSARRHGVYYGEVEEEQAAELRRRIAQFLETPAPEGDRKGGALPHVLGLGAKAPAQKRLQECRVTVLNGTAIAGAARRVADLVATAGATPLGTGNAPTKDVDKTQVLYRPEARAAAAQLVSLAGADARAAQPMAPGYPAGAADIVIVLGQDIARKIPG
jgi:LCP family protein required for cell wall assembly